MLNPRLCRESWFSHPEFHRRFHRPDTIGHNGRRGDERFYRKPRFSDDRVSTRVFAEPVLTVLTQLISSCQPIVQTQKARLDVTEDDVTVQFRDIDRHREVRASEVRTRIVDRNIEAAFRWLASLSHGSQRCSGGALRVHGNGKAYKDTKAEKTFLSGDAIADLPWTEQENIESH
ncbi:hypothetical protein ABZ639_12495 [Saccharomonospora sp. NPDC006951]